jgi:hypothetical protein
MGRARESCRNGPWRVLQSGIEPVSPNTGIFWVARVLRTALELALMALAMASPPAFSQSGATTPERQVKAAFLYRFIDYVRWPESAFPKPDSQIVIGVLADSAMVEEVQSITAGRSVRGHPLAVKAVKEGDYAGLHVLFVGEGVNPRLRRIIRAVEGPVLVVTEAEDGLAQGSVINFVIADRRVRFEVALMPAAARSLNIASGLLSVAINVRKDSLRHDSWSFPLALGDMRRKGSRPADLLPTG